MNLPKARTTDIIEQEVGNELMIYDLRINNAYNLNETSKNVYKACDGKTTFDDFKSRYKYTDDLIHFAIDQLSANNLIENYKSVHFAGINRRDVIKKVGLSSMIALPMIAGIIAPSAANAASGGFAPGSRNLTETCNTSTDCTGAAPNCVGTTNNRASQGTRCCVSTSNDSRIPTFDTQSFETSGTCTAGCTDCQCARDYCNANASPCCSGTFTSTNFNGLRIFCNCF
jgi:hypothetical protein